MIDHYKRMIEVYEQYIKDKIFSVADRDNEFFGVNTDQYGLSDNSYTISLIINDCVVYSCKDLSGYKNEQYLYEILRGCESLMRRLHKDGTTDMLISNFRTPGTFELNGLTEQYRILEKYSSGTELEKKALDALKEVIIHMGDGLLASGFHTPNHRWVESAALLGVYDISGKKELLEKAEKYLAEGIDIDENGEFTERSAGMYNKVNDWALMLISKYGKKPEILDHVYKNLKLMLGFIEHDGSVFTQNSSRKDKGEVATSKRWSASVYYYLYLVVGYLKKDPGLIKMADFIFDTAIRNGEGVPGGITYFLEYPELITWEPDLDGVTLSDSYEFYLSKSNIFRVRKGKWSYSLLGNENPNFLFFHCGKINGYMRICASFFAVAQFAVKKLEKSGDSYTMSFHAHGEYRLPYENPPKTSVWREMDYSARGVVMPVELYIDVRLTPKDDGFDLNIKTSGCENVPIKIETVISEGTRIFTDSSVQNAKAGGSLVLKSGELVLDDVAGNLITINGAFASHLYAEAMRGSLPQSGDAFSVYFTGQTHIDKTLTVRFSRRTEPFYMD